MKRKTIGISLLSLGAAMMITSCSTTTKKNGTGEGISVTTGWPLNDSRYGGFEVTPFRGQPRPIGMAFVQGGRFTMGAVDDEMPTMENNSMRRTVSVSSFYMDETELENVSYREYTYWMYRAYNSDYPELVAGCYPDATVWRNPLSYNEPYVQNYFESNAYDHYPVVGVNWYQAKDYCKWRTDRVNEQMLILNGQLNPNPQQSNEDVFTTESYLKNQYEGTVGSNPHQDLDPNGQGSRKVTRADGIFYPDYRLPTEAEWEYAALGLIGNNPSPENKRRRGEEVVTDRNSLPWGPKNTTRYGLHNQYQGEFEGNYMRAKGDYMGVAGGLNDAGDATVPVRSFLPNAFGLYNMSGNVSEWVMDTYRPSSHEDVNDFRSFRGNQYQKLLRTEDGEVEEKDSLGHIQYVDITPAEVMSSNHYDQRTANLHNYRDGDSLSQFVYKYGENTLVNDSTKVYKGGSWGDRAYWLSPGTRRYTQGNMGSAFIGFRCVMDRMGSPHGDAQEGGNYFGQFRYRKR